MSAEMAKEIIGAMEPLIEHIRELEDENHALKLAAAGGEDVPGSASMVTPADVEQWRVEALARERRLEAEVARLEAEKARLRADLEAAERARDAANAAMSKAQERASDLEQELTALREAAEDVFSPWSGGEPLDREMRELGKLIGMGIAPC
jgi:chromosome segregation ATPase